MVIHNRIYKEKQIPGYSCYGLKDRMLHQKTVCSPTSGIIMDEPRSSSATITFTIRVVRQQKFIKFTGSKTGST
jgi:hypothetical protein